MFQHGGVGYGGGGGGGGGGQSMHGGSGGGGGVGGVSTGNNSVPGASIAGSLCPHCGAPMAGDSCNQCGGTGYNLDPGVHELGQPAAAGGENPSERFGANKAQSLAATRVGPGGAIAGQRMPVPNKASPNPTKGKINPALFMRPGRARVS